MKKLILFIAFALLFTIFSCTPDEFETQPTKKVEKPIDKAHAGPGDHLPPPPPPEE
ncbi:hypothetical protein [Flavobacterium sp. DG2-3]|uniref:hypothetical protein n=1 Tax=Flavobacterium sp. DG2-3 TaxID=3068317 RepID=UPI00273E9BDF|nr:hypothetical protein [Flavobacterium sp. DG2-3]MDP5199483.1 hypothetical protein [Flavobacterium sp. DG2-3]